MTSDISWVKIKNLPVLPPPPGVTPDFAHPTSRAYELHVVAGICIPIIVFFAAVRFYAKFSILRRWTWDDVTCGLGVIAALVEISLNIGGVNQGVYGKHAWEVKFGMYSASASSLHLVMEVLYGPFIWFVKLSLFVLYVQIFRPLRWLCFLAWAGAVLTGLLYFATSIAFAVLCAPSGGHSAFNYLTAYRSSRCLSATNPLVTIIGVLSLVSDIYLVILPLPAVWKLQLPFRRKLGVSAMFLTGIGYVRGPIFKHWQSLASTKISVYKKTRSSYHPDRSTACEVGSVPNNRPSLRDRDYDSSTRLTDEVQVPRNGQRSQTSDWLSEYEKRSTFLLDDSQIRKTTDITITR
ncbi:MAG: hypothetical protein Q9220_002380 [cf. Caloplaca sp. 1 TL-2023]